jgi:hypothetical protein
MTEQEPACVKLGAAWLRKRRGVPVAIPAFQPEPSYPVLIAERDSTKSLPVPPRQTSWPWLPEENKKGNLLPLTSPRHISVLPQTVSSAKTPLGVGNAITSPFDDMTALGHVLVERKRASPIGQLSTLAAEVAQEGQRWVDRLAALRR